MSTTNNIPNLDAMPSKELWSFWEKYRYANRKECAQLVGDTRRGYTTIALTLAHYAANKATAMECRERGKIEAAQTYEKICERIYLKIPPDLRW